MSALHDYHVRRSWHVLACHLLTRLHTLSSLVLVQDVPSGKAPAGKGGRAFAIGDCENVFVAVNFGGCWALRSLPWFSWPPAC